MAKERPPSQVSQVWISVASVASCVNLGKKWELTGLSVFSLLCGVLRHWWWARRWCRWSAQHTCSAWPMAAVEERAATVAMQWASEVEKEALGWWGHRTDRGSSPNYVLFRLGVNVTGSNGSLNSFDGFAFFDIPAMRIALDVCKRG